MSNKWCALIPRPYILAGGAYLRDSARDHSQSKTGGKMKLPETKPVTFPQSNDRLYPSRMEDEQLPVCRNDENITSCWRIPWVKRWKVLLTGRVYLVVRGQTQPPLWIDTEAF
jgi:hypothetical protein